jgi:hypothetical protein
MESFRNKFKTGCTTGIQKGWGSSIWMMKILIPISLFTQLLAYGGWLKHLDFLLAPMMGFLGLPAAAAMPLIAGILTGIYGGIAAMLVFPFTTQQMTLIAIFLLISHNMIQEGVVQGKSGMNAFKATVIRLIASVITTVIVAYLIGVDSPMTSAQSGAAASVQQPFWVMLGAWGTSTLYLCAKIIVIVMTLMIVLSLLKSFNLIPRIVKVLLPILKILGVEERVGILWLTGAVFGIAYGAAVIMEEAREGNFTEEELTGLHISLGINHAIVEDPSLFVAVGLSAFWMWIPRLATAVIFVHLYRLWLKFRVEREVCPVRNS